MAGDGGGRDERKVRSVEEMISPEVELGMGGDRDGGGDDGGTAVRRRRRSEAAATVVVAAATAARRHAAAAAAVGPLPRPSLSSHLRGRSLLSFFK